jgi:hypothetical protein
MIYTCALRASTKLGPIEGMQKLRRVVKNIILVFSVVWRVAIHSYYYRTKWESNIASLVTVGSPFWPWKIRDRRMTLIWTWVYPWDNHWKINSCGKWRVIKCFVVEYEINYWSNLEACTNSFTWRDLSFNKVLKVFFLKKSIIIFLMDFVRVYKRDVCNRNYWIFM